MQLSTYGNQAQVTGVQHTQAFQMQMNAKMFSILTDKLYQNKEGAIIRELSANARDAHVSAGKEDQPFEISLPTWLSSEFKIRDYGTGIDPEEFYDTYTNLGHSTKDHENNSIGAYGLGSKTPFAITDQYTIRNFYDGNVYLYTAFKSEGMPTVSLIGSEPTDEPNGLEISVDTTQQGTVRQFTKECGEQLRFFKVKPTIVNDPDFEWPEVLDLSKGYHVASGYYHSDVVVVMGGIPYKASTHGLPPELKEKFDRIVLTLSAELGEVDIPPSRESLELTKKTLAFLSDSVDKICREYTISFTDSISKVTNLSELDDVTHARVDAWLSTKKFRAHEFTYKGEEVTGDMIDKFLSRDIKGITVKQSASYYKTFRKTHDISVYGLKQITRRNRFTDGGLNTMYINDLGPRINKLLTANKKTIGNNSAIVSTTEQKTKLFAEATVKVEETLKELGFTITKLSSIISLPTVIKGAKKKYSNRPDQVFSIDSFGEADRRSVDILPTEGYYVEMSNWSIALPFYHLEFLVNDLGKDVYALRSHAAKEAKLQGELTHVSALQPEVTKLLLKKLKNCDDASTKFSQLSGLLPHGFFDNKLFERMETIDSTTKVCKLVTACHDIHNEYKATSLPTRYTKLKDSLKIKPKPSKAKVPAYIVKLAEHARVNYATALDDVFSYNRWASKDSKGFSQTLNLIVGNYK